LKLDLIIPHYKEPWSTCKYLFDTIATQRGIPFESVRAIVVDDGEEDALQLDGWEQYGEYPYYQKYYVKTHEGVSAARNYGLDHSDADYVMFCDIDDGFLNNYALHLIFSAMQEGFDVCVANFVEETFTEDGQMTIVPHDQDLTFMHGKVYRRQFLVNHNLRFDPAMNVHEDGYFNMVAYATAQHEGKIKSITTPLYLWRWNDNSVVRSNRKDFVLRTYADVVKTRFGICEQLKARGYEDDYRTSVCMTVLNSYYDFQKSSYNSPENARYAKEAEKEFKKFWVAYKKVFMDLTNQKIAEIARVARENAYKNGMLYEQVALKTWLKHIEYEVKI